MANDWAAKVAKLMRVEWSCPVCGFSMPVGLRGLGAWGQFGEMVCAGCAEWTAGQIIASRGIRTIVGKSFRIPLQIGAA